MSKVCLVGIDGLRLDVARQESPALRRLIDSGALAAMQIRMPTISGPSWTTLLTGASYDDHGIVDNRFVDGRHAALPDFLSRVAAADHSVRTFAAADWLPLVDPNSAGPVIHFRPADQRSGRHTVVMRDGEHGDCAATDAEIADAARQALADGVDASFVYFGEADHAAHAYGGLSPEYRSAIGRIDDHLQSLVEVIDKRAADHGEDWVLVITTDHGHLDQGGHGGDSELETTSFALARSFGPGASVGTAAPHDWPATLQPTELAPRLIDLASR